MTLRELSALAFENARRTEQMRQVLLRRGSEGARDSAHMSLLRAATDDTGNLRHLWTAIRDARELHPDGDPRRSAPMVPPQPPSAVDERNPRAHRVAYEVLEGQRPLPAAGDLLACLAEQPPEEGPPPSDGVHPHGKRDLAEVAVRALDALTERAAAGWPAYAIPWRHALREEAALRLLAKARTAHGEGADATGPLTSLAALVVLERDVREAGWADSTWATLRAFAADRTLPPLLASVLTAALDTERPPASLSSLVVAASEGRVPATPEAVANLVDRAARAVGCLSAKTIDTDPVRNALRRLLTDVLTDPSDGLLMASVLRELRGLSAWEREPRTARYLMAKCALRPVVLHSPSVERRNRAGVTAAVLAYMEASERGNSDADARHGSNLSDADVTASSVVAELIDAGTVTDAALALMRDVMGARCGAGSRLAERALEVACAGLSATPSEPALAAEVASASEVDPQTVAIAHLMRAVREGRPIPSKAECAKVAGCSKQAAQKWWAFLAAHRHAQATAQGGSVRRGVVDGRTGSLDAED